jgi:hypothetical protein
LDLNSRHDLPLGAILFKRAMGIDTSGKIDPE